MTIRTAFIFDDYSFSTEGGWLTNDCKQDSFVYRKEQQK